MNAVIPPNPAAVYDQIEALGAQQNQLVPNRLRGTPLERFCALLNVVDAGLGQAQAVGNQQLAQDWALCWHRWEDLCKAIKADGISHCCDRHRPHNPVPPI